MGRTTAGRRYERAAAGGPAPAVAALRLAAAAVDERHVGERAAMALPAARGHTKVRIALAVVNILTGGRSCGRRQTTRRVRGTALAASSDVLFARRSSGAAHAPAGMGDRIGRQREGSRASQTTSTPGARRGRDGWLHGGLRGPPPRRRFARWELPSRESFIGGATCCAW